MHAFLHNTCRIISCLKEFTFAHHILHKDGMQMSLEMNLKIKKLEK